MKSVRLSRTFFLCTLTCTLTFAAPCTAGTGSGAELLPAGAEAYVPIPENLQDKDGTREPGFYHNMSGKMDITRSEDVSEAVFTERTERMEQERRIAEFTPLSQPVLAGKQASLPAGNGEASVLSRFGFGNILMGGWSEQQGWLNARELQNSPRFHKFRIWGGEACRVLGMYGLVEGNAVISAVHTDHPDEYPSVRTPSFDVHSPSGVISPPSTVLTLLCDWEAQPRKPEPVLMKTNAPYERRVKDYLASRGLHTQEIRIVQTCRIDLEGDGVDEVLVCAQNMVGHADYRKPDGLLAVPDHAHKGMYSILLLRKIVDGKVVQLPLHEHIVSTAQAAERPPVLGRLYLFADLNGDGVMEIIAGTVSPTESVHRIFEVKGGNIREVLSGKAHG